MFQFLGFAQNSSKSKEIVAVAVRVENLRQVMIDADGEKRKELTSENLYYDYFEYSESNY